MQLCVRMVSHGLIGIFAVFDMQRVFCTTLASRAWPTSRNQTLQKVEKDDAVGD